jgi:hypothetical protein
MLQLENNTPFAPAMAVFPNRDAIDTLYVVVKGTFTLRPRLALAEAAAPAVLSDEYYGEPGFSSIKYASELHIGKAGTDVILMGHAYAVGHDISESAVLVRAAERKKLVRVFGDRFWRLGGFTRPEPFDCMPLIFERAYGGQQQVSPDEVMLAEEHNPVGVGFRGRRSASEMDGQPLPNLEDPRHSIEALGARVPPACFGFVAPSWLPRRAFAGTYDKAWQTKRAPYLPRDFDQRFFNAAAPELTFQRFLMGGEPVEVLGASREGPIRFEVPRCQPRVTIRVMGRREAPPLRLETLLIEPDLNRVSVSWRAELACDKQVLKVEAAIIEVDGLDAIQKGAA